MCVYKDKYIPTPVKSKIEIKVTMLLFDRIFSCLYILSQLNLAQIFFPFSSFNLNIVVILNICCDISNYLTMRLFLSHFLLERILHLQSTCLIIQDFRYDYITTRSGGQDESYSGSLFTAPQFMVVLTSQPLH